MKVVFLRMDNWLKKKMKTTSVSETDSMVHTKNVTIFKDFTRNEILQMVHINTFLVQASLSYDFYSVLMDSH